MNVSLLLPIVPWNVSLYLAIPLLIFGGLVWYALRTKDHVHAMFSHGKTVFKLEAKQRGPRRNARPTRPASLRGPQQIPNRPQDGMKFFDREVGEKHEDNNRADRFKSVGLDSKE
jgi:hypothetical protein